MLEVIQRLQDKMMENLGFDERDMSVRVAIMKLALNEDLHNYL